MYVTNGVRQGGVLSPQLFNVYIFFYFFFTRKILFEKSSKIILCYFICEQVIINK